ncbi:MAG TPA: sigma factor-like helix-turn-helix DNA-binding protein [Methylocella sp.]
MSLRDDLNLCAPRLRRFARALVGGHPAPNKTADGLVQDILLQTLQQGASLRLNGPDLQIHLYALLTGQLHKLLAKGRVADAAHTEAENFGSGGAGTSGLSRRFESSSGQFAHWLLDIPLEEREALLLVALEGFGYAQAARILQISRTVFVARLARARAALGDIPDVHFVPHSEKPLPVYLRLVK